MSEYLRFIECLKQEGIEYSVVDPGLSRLPIMVTAARFGRIISWWFDNYSEKLEDMSVEFVF